MFFKRSKPNLESNQFLACHLEEARLQLAIWETLGEEVILKHVGAPKEWQDETTLVDAIEIGLEELDVKASELRGVLYGVPESWTHGEELTTESKQLLKKVSDKKRLEALGFVVTTDALLKALKDEHGANFHALLFDITSPKFRILLMQQGKLNKEETVGRSEDTASDIVEGLSRCAGAPYPQLVFLWSNTVPVGDLKEIKQHFLGITWPEDTFLQTPDVRLLPPEVMLQAICLIGGKEVAKALLTGEADGLEEESMESEESGTQESALLSVRTAGALSEDTDESSVPFLQAAEEEEPKPKFQLPFLRKGARFKVTSSRGKFSLVPKLIAGVVIVLIVLLLGSWVWARTTLRATVHATLKVESISADTQIVIDPELSAPDVENKRLNARPVTQEVTDSEETSTTGTKLIGEKAKGTVTLYNRTEIDKTFPAGTEVKTGEYVFLFDQEVNIASGSVKEAADFTKTLEPGKKDVAVTAIKIGAEYNLGKDTEFSVANFGKDTYVAKSTAAFTGGSSREIQAVSKDDQTKLSTSLRESLIEQAQQKLKESVADGEYVVMTGNAEVTNQEFSAKVDDETNLLKLTMSVEAEGFVYTSIDLQPLAKSVLADQLPVGAQFLEDKLSILSKEGERASDSAQITLEAKLSAGYLPAISLEDWKIEIGGKTREQALGILRQKSEISNVEVTLRPSLANWFGLRLPKKSERIEVQTRIEE